MLAIDIKKTDKADLSSALVKYIKSNYGKDEAKRAEPLFDEIQNTRNEVRGVFGREGGPAAKASRDLLVKYYRQISLLETRLPFGDGKGQVKIGFTWYDSFKPNKKAFMYALALEKASVLYNVGSIYTFMGVHNDRATPEGLKEACQHFCVAAGIFQFVRDTIVSSVFGGLTADISPEGLNMAISLMLAQAQACYYEKAVKDKLNKNLLSKLAMGASDMYEGVVNIAQRSPLSSIVERPWLNILSYQSMSFRAAAQYWQSVIAKESAAQTGNGYGVQIARLQLSLRYAEEALRMAGAMPSTVVEGLTKLHQTISSELFEVDKDNRQIYMESVPHPDSLPAIQKISPVKIGAIPNDLYERAPGSEILDQLIPHDVQVSLTEYQQRVESLVRANSEMVTLESEAARKVLQDNNLPYALEALEHIEGIPQALWNRCLEVGTRGGSQALENMVAGLTKLQDDNSELLKNVEKELLEEEREDMEMAARFGPQWNRLPSSSLNTQLKQDINRYRDKLQQATNADNIVRDKFHEQKEKLMMLSKTKPELDAMIPAKDPTQTNAAEEEANTLRQLLGQLNQLLDERAKALEDLVKTAEADNVVTQLLQARQAGQNKETVFAEELGKYTPKTQAINENVEAQAALLVSILEANTRFTDAQQISKQTSLRAKFIQDLEMSVNSYNEINGHATEGARFYAQLGDHLRRLGQSTSDFVFARNTEKKDLLNEVQRSAAGVSAPPQQNNAPRPITPVAAPGSTVSQDGMFSRLLYPAAVQRPPMGGQPPAQHPHQPPMQQQQMPYGMPMHGPGGMGGMGRPPLGAVPYGFPGQGYSQHPGFPPQGYAQQGYGGPGYPGAPYVPGPYPMGQRPPGPMPGYAPYPPGPQAGQMPPGGPQSTNPFANPVYRK